MFVDESGDLGLRKKQGSTRYFTIALVLFERPEAALACQRSIENLQIALKLPSSYEFHFHGDSHTRRLALLTVVSQHVFYCYTFTLNKTSPRLTGPGFQYRSPAYKWVCRRALENAKTDLVRATVVIDGSGEREFRKQMDTYLRREVNTDGGRHVHRVKIGRSHNDPLLQLADYVAGVTNRLYEGKAGAEVYEQLLRNKRRSQRMWP